MVLSNGLGLPSDVSSFHLVPLFGGATFAGVAPSPFLVRIDYHQSFAHGKTKFYALPVGITHHSSRLSGNFNRVFLVGICCFFLHPHWWPLGLIIKLMSPLSYISKSRFHLPVASNQFPLQACISPMIPTLVGLVTAYSHHQNDRSILIPTSDAGITRPAGPHRQAFVPVCLFLRRQGLLPRPRPLASAKAS
jgi:hypothetical protein